MNFFLRTNIANRQLKKSQKSVKFEFSEFKKKKIALKLFEFLEKITIEPFFLQN